VFGGCIKSFSNSAFHHLLLFIHSFIPSSIPLFIYYPTNLSEHLSNHSSCHLSIHPPTYSLLTFHPSTHLFIYTSYQPSTIAFVNYLSTHCCTHQQTRLPIYLSVPPCSHSLTPSTYVSNLPSVHSFTDPLIHPLTLISIHPLFHSQSIWSLARHSRNSICTVLFLFRFNSLYCLPMSVYLVQKKYIKILNASLGLL
jgi:hypothetical protein